MNDLVPAVGLSDDEMIDVLGASVYPGALPASIRMVLGWCKASGKDPLKKPVHIVPMSVKVAGRKKGDEYEWRDVLMQGINDYRTDAARTGQHVGNLPAQFGPVLELEYRAEVWSDGENGRRVKNVVPRVLRYPEWCEFTVLRWVHGEARAFSSGRVWFMEAYATAGRDSDAPNAMWAKRPFGQLEKCAEALALRRGFPEVGSVPTSDELAGRTTLELDPDGMVVDAATGEIVGQAGGAPAPASGIKMPQARSAKALTDDPSPTLQQQPVRQAETIGAKPETNSAQRETRNDPRPGFATEGERAFIKRKLAELGLSIEAACEEVGITKFEELTADGFVTLKEYIVGAGARS